MEITKFDLFAAVEEGDITTLEQFFAQPHALQEALEVEALLTDDVIRQVNYHGNVAAATISVNSWVYLHDRNRNPFQLAVKFDQFAVLQWLYESPVIAALSRTRHFFMMSAGSCAIAKSSFDILEYLLTSPVYHDPLFPEIARQNLLGLLLEVSISYNKTQAIEILIAHGADVNMEQTAWMESPLSRAAATDHSGKTVLCLLRNGASILNGDDVNSAVEYGLSDAARTLIQHGVDPRHVNRSGETVLHHAAYEGYHEMIRVLLSMEAIDLDRVSNSEDTALSVAVKENPFEPEDIEDDDFQQELVFHPRVVEVLLEFGANPNLYSDRYTVLGWAAIMGNLAIATTLVQHGADLEEALLYRDLVGSWLELVRPLPRSFLVVGVLTELDEFLVYEYDGYDSDVGGNNEEKKLLVAAAAKALRSFLLTGDAQDEDVEMAYSGDEMVE